MDSPSTIIPYEPFDKDFRTDFYDWGCWKTGYRKIENLDYLEAGAFIGSDDFKEDVLSDIEEIVKLCEDSGVELVVFTNPMHHLTYEASLDADWYGFARELAKRTDFINFAGLNEITTDDYNYYDTSHYVSGIGDEMIAKMEDGKDTRAIYGESFGFEANADNIEELIEIWEKERGSGE